MEDQKKAVIDKLKGANNILVTVSANPSVDQLAACIGLTILLNKLKKHATAVFSGAVPSTIEFLKPEDTLERNTDSLRDFIISLDKAKADKLRYKVEENVVKIFITPYKTSISQEDLDFSQGDFNVDVVLALGVHEQQQLDEAITMHGRILHDAIVMSVNTATGADLGSINWTDVNASSLSELAVQLSNGLAKDLIDGQIATSFLTGIVAETERFSNEKTNPETMKLSAELLTAGANQQLVASELMQEGSSRGSSGGSSGVGSSTSAPPQANDGTLEINHPQAELDEEHHEIPHDEDEPVRQAQGEPGSDDETLPEMTLPDVKDVKQNNFEDTLPSLDKYVPQPSQLPPPHYLTEPPALGGELTANTDQEDPDDRMDMMAEHHEDIPMLDHNAKSEPVQQAQDKPQQQVWQPQVVAPVPPKDEPKMPAQQAQDKPEPAPEEHEPELVKEPVKEDLKPDEPIQQVQDKPIQQAQDESAFSLPPSPPKQDSFSAFRAQPPAPAPVEPPQPPNDQIHIDADGNIQGLDVPAAPVFVAPPPAPAPVTPTFTPPPITPTPPLTPLSPAPAAPVAPPSVVPPTPASLPGQPVAGAADDQKLTEIEKAVHSPHLRPEKPMTPPTIEPIQEPSPPNDLDAARSAVLSAINGPPATIPTPKQDTGASGYLKVADLPDMDSPSGAPMPPPSAAVPEPDAAPATYAPPMTVTPPSSPSGITLPIANPVPPTTPAGGPTTPPPVPPPMTEMPPFVTPSNP